MELWFDIITMTIAFAAGLTIGLGWSKRQMKKARQVPLLGVVLPPEGKQ